MRGSIKRTILILVRQVPAVLLICLFLGGCGGGSVSVPEDSASKSEKLDKGGFKAAEFADAVFDAGSAKGNDEAQVDLAHTQQGYIGVLVDTDARVKLQVFKDENTFVYDVPLGEPQIFPLQCGNGRYTFKVMKNVEDSKYYELYTCDADVKLASEFEPFLRPNQYADYRADSKCVEKARSMAEKAGSEEDFVGRVYDYICGNITYDMDKAIEVESGYIPDPDKIMAEGKGICFDYASLAASMLRSQGIPTKIIFGYVEPDNLYHAWNMFYTEENGWTTVEFSVSQNDWSRVDMTFAANGADGEFIGDGSNYTDVYFY